MLKSCWFWLSPYIVKFSGSYSWFIFQPRKGWCTGVDRIGSNLYPQLLVSVLFLVLNTCDLEDIYCVLGLCNYGNTMVFVFIVIFRSRLLLPEKKKNIQKTLQNHCPWVLHGIFTYIWLIIVVNIYIYMVAPPPPKPTFFKKTLVFTVFQAHFDL